MSAHVFFEFIKRVEKKRSNARLVEHFIYFFATSLINSIYTRAQKLDSICHN